MATILESAGLEKGCKAFTHSSYWACSGPSNGRYSIHIIIIILRELHDLLKAFSSPDWLYLWLLLGAPEETGLLKPESSSYFKGDFLMVTLHGACGGGP